MQNLKWIQLASVENFLCRVFGKEKLIPPYFFAQVGFSDLYLKYENCRGMHVSLNEVAGLVANREAAE